MGELGLVKPGHAHPTQSRAESWVYLKTAKQNPLGDVCSSLKCLIDRHSPRVLHPEALPPFSGSEPSTALLASTSLLIPTLPPSKRPPLLGLTSFHHATSFYFSSSPHSQVLCALHPQPRTTPALNRAEFSPKHSLKKTHPSCSNSHQGVCEGVGSSWILR